MEKTTTLTGDPSLVDPGFAQPPANPLHLLQQWLAQAEQLKISEPRDLVLATIDTSGRPSSRVVLLKTVDDQGVVFASSELSQKGKDLAQNPVASGTLYWRETMQQINFFGIATQLPANISDKIFIARPRAAQAVAAICQQSAIMTDEAGLRAAIIKRIKQPGKIARPQTWQAYHIRLETVEFWHGRRDRFHHRLRYDRQNDYWTHQKRQP